MLRYLCFKVFRNKFKGINKGFTVLDIIGRAIEVGEQPFMRIKYKAICLFNSTDHPAIFGQDQGRPCMGSVNMQPYLILCTNCSNILKRINGCGTGSAKGCNDAQRE